jgi:hypothetical protein
MAPPEPGRTLIRWHWQEERVVSCIPPEAAATRFGKGIGFSDGYGDARWDAFVLAAQSAVVLHHSGWLAVLEKE